jgi:hypothetical protein
MCIGKSSFTTTTQYTLSTFIHIFKWWGYRGQVVGENSKAKWWGYRGQVVGELQGQVVGILRSTGGGNYQGQVAGISRSSSGDIKAKWWGYQGQGEGLRGQGKKKVVGGACPLQLPLLGWRLL